MLEIDISVVKGILFVHLEGVLNRDTVRQLINELNYLLYKQGMLYYVLDFKDLDKLDYSVMPILDNKLTEIFLSCGKVVISGLDNYHNCYKQDNLFYVRDGIQALNYLAI